MRLTSAPRCYYVNNIKMNTIDSYITICHSESVIVLPARRHTEAMNNLVKALY